MMRVKEKPENAFISSSNRGKKFLPFHKPLQAIQAIQNSCLIRYSDPTQHRWKFSTNSLNSFDLCWQAAVCLSCAMAHPNLDKHIRLSVKKRGKPGIAFEIDTSCFCSCRDERGLEFLR